MNGMKRLTSLCLAMIWLAGCAVRKYQPAPISPANTAAHLESRNLQDQGLREFLEKNIGHPLSSWPLQSWDLSTLTLAAVYFSSEMETARARAEAADAAIITAGARPNPTLSVQPGVPSPYLLSLDLDFPIETAGKRGYRIEGAKQLTAATQLDLATTAWKVRSQVRQAFLDYMAADRETDIAHTEGPAIHTGQLLDLAADCWRGGAFRR
jgi:cobalt-zinc-cadmium efflux system outer membrane protein